MTMRTMEVTAGFTSATTFLADPEVTDDVARMYAADLRGQGYVAHLTRLWAHSPGTMTAMANVLDLSVAEASLTFRQRALLVSACASAMSDSYCSLAWGSKLSAAAGEETAAAVLAGDDSSLPREERVLATWARRMVRDPNATTEFHVAEMRAAGLRRAADLRAHRLRGAAPRLRDGQRHTRCRAGRRTGRARTARRPCGRDLRTHADAAIGHHNCTDSQPHVHKESDMTRSTPRT